MLQSPSALGGGGGKGGSKKHAGGGVSTSISRSNGRESSCCWSLYRHGKKGEGAKEREKGGGRGRKEESGRESTERVVSAKEAQDEDKEGWGVVGRREIDGRFPPPRQCFCSEILEFYPCCSRKEGERVEGGGR
jgi:hypothetical protein